MAEAAGQQEEGRFTFELEQTEGYEFKVYFDRRKLPDLIMDEPPPLGEGNGPTASRLLAAAVANCLSASLIHCIYKGEVPAAAVRTRVTCRLVRNDKKRLRIGGMEVKLIVADELAQSKRFERCKTLFEDFCVVSASIRQGIPIKVSVLDQQGQVLHSSE